jgi:hypothetical protein
LWVVIEICCSSAMQVILVSSGEKVLALESGKTIVMGRGIGPLKDCDDKNCSRHQVPNLH